MEGDSVRGVVVGGGNHAYSPWTAEVDEEDSSSEEEDQANWAAGKEVVVL